MKFKFKEPGGIEAFGIFVSSDEWTEVEDEAAAAKLRNNSHFECKEAGRAAVKPEKVEESPTEEAEAPRRRRRTKAAS